MAQKDVDRFEALIVPHLDDAYTLARYLLQNEHDAQDAVQDAAVRAIRYFDGYRSGDARAWFLTIVRNCCMSSFSRNQNATVPITDEHLAIPHDASATDAGAIRASDREAIERGLQMLQMEFREVIVMREVHGMSYAEISEVTGAPVGTVMSRLSRARRQMATLLGSATRGD